MTDIAALKKALGPIKTEDNAAIVKQKSRDFYWYSPVLKRQLDDVTADLIVSPTSEAEVIETLKICHSMGVPVTPRGTGTGNYGQAMPLSGGVVLNLAEMNAVKEIKQGSYVAEAGAIIADIDRAAITSGQEVRLHPSTYHTASIGGFIAGGSGGVGSINFGGLRDLGNIIRVRVVTMEENPRVLELSGYDLHKVSHAYGTNGIITEVEMPLAAHYNWVDFLIGFDDWERCVQFSNELAQMDGLLTKNVAPIEAPVPHDYFLRHKKFIERGQSVAVVIAAPQAASSLQAFAEKEKGAILYRSDIASEEEKKGLPPGYELSWNHTTLRALRVDPSITYLQVLYPFPDAVKKIVRMSEIFGEELPGHAEFVRFDGDVTAFGLPMVRFTTEERLEEIMKIHEAEGCPIFNPHRYTLEEGGMKETDEIQLAFKRESDPDGLLNPGKMVAWENPDFDFSNQTYLFTGLKK
ncbi:MAG: FAD-binding oxidoreductase [Pseudomonadota bacterium]